MTGLIFLATLLAILVFAARLIIKAIKHKPVGSTIKILAAIICAYGVLSSIFYFVASNKPVPLGTDICFDDWCATVTKTERVPFLATGNDTLKAEGEFVILYVTMSNHARGIAQKPSEPRIHIIDEQGKARAFSATGQRQLEKLTGKQISLESKLELNQSLQTELVFDVPKGAKKLAALIEEGPFITKLLFPEDKQVFDIP